MTRVIEGKRGSGIEDPSSHLLIERILMVVSHTEFDFQLFRFSVFDSQYPSLAARRGAMAAIEQLMAPAPAA